MRRPYLLALLPAALAVVWIACTPPDRSVDDAGSDSCANCVGVTDGGPDAKETGPQDAEPDAPTRSELCPVGCNPDPGFASSTCSLDAGAPDGAAELACQVVRNTEGLAAAKCVTAGGGHDGDFCQKSSDCSPGLACVVHPSEKDLNSGRCRTYCCESTEKACATGTYCGLLPLYEPNKPFPDALPIPVCAPATGCTLLDPGACGTNQTCALVNEKTTTCVTPGDGKDGDACPCAAGHYCNPGPLVCRKVCHLGGDAAECPSGVCVLGGDVFPSGFGVCGGG